MKKKTFPFLVYSLIALFYSQFSFGQSKGSEMNAIASIQNSASNELNKYEGDTEKMTETNILTAGVQKNFAKKYPQASSAQWIKSEKCFMVSFMNNAQKTTAVFKENGDLNYAITDLKKENIPAGFKQLIKKDYHGLHIIQAIEINNNGNIMHQVILEGAASYITIKAIGEEIEVSTIKNASATK